VMAVSCQINLEKAGAICLQPVPAGTGWHWLALAGTGWIDTGRDGTGAVSPRFRARRAQGQVPGRVPGRTPGWTGPRFSSDVPRAPPTPTPAAAGWRGGEDVQCCLVPAGNSHFLPDIYCAICILTGHHR
jgi:hypothetical protein